MHKFSHWILLILYFTLLSQCNTYINHEQIPKASQGILDLRNWNFDRDGPISLQGEWEFYWEEFISGLEENQSPSVTEHHFITLPGSWKNYQLDGRSLPRAGYASFRLIVLTSGLPESLAFKLSEQTNPLTIYVNNTLITSIGKIGKTENQEVYDSVPQLANFSITGKVMEIIIHVSNFTYRQLAGQKPIILGKAEYLAHTRMLQLLIRLFISGAIFIIALYHAVIFFVLKKNKGYNLFFAIVCLCWILRYFLIKDCDFNFIFSALSWELQKKLVTTAIFFAMVCFIFYMKFLFPRDVPIKLHLLNIVPGSIAFISYWSLPTTLFTHYAYYSVFYLHSAVLFFIGTTVYSLITICRRKRKHGIFFTISTGILLFGFLLEVFSFYFYPELAYPSFYIILLFIFFQTYININTVRSHQKRMEELENQLQERKIEVLKIESSQKVLCLEKVDWLLQNNKITSREKEIINKIVENKRNGEIANDLFISYFTVRRHIHNIYRKLQVEDRVKLVKYLIQR